MLCCIVLDHYGIVLAPHLSRGHICFVSRFRLDTDLIRHIIITITTTIMICYVCYNVCFIVAAIVAQFVSGRLGNGRLCASCVPTWANTSESGARMFIPQGHARKPRQGPLCRRAV
jgi:hypothetical protein